LREIREQKGMTQEALAGQVGVTRQTIIALEKGKFGPSVALALQLARVLGTTVDDLFWLNDQQPKPSPH
jgi:putative transcriptional regulator